MVKQLQEELRQARLYNKLLEALVDIGKEKYDINLRKKWHQAVFKMEQQEPDRVNGLCCFLLGCSRHGLYKIQKQHQQ